MPNKIGHVTPEHLALAGYEQVQPATAGFPGSVWKSGDLQVHVLEDSVFGFVWNPQALLWERADEEVLDDVNAGLE